MVNSTPQDYWSYEPGQGRVLDIRVLKARVAFATPKPLSPPVHVDIPKKAPVIKYPYLSQWDSKPPTPVLRHFSKRSYWMIGIALALWAVSITLQLF